MNFVLSFVMNLSVNLFPAKELNELREFHTESVISFLAIEFKELCASFYNELVSY